MADIRHTDCTDDVHQYVTGTEACVAPKDSRWNHKHNHVAPERIVCMILLVLPGTSVP